MAAFIYSTLLQWKLDMRNKNVLITYYIVPLIFFLFMGGIFTSIMPLAYKTLIQAMTVFGITMGAVLGSPATLIQIYGSDIKKAYYVGGIPLWTVAASNFISAFIHLLCMSIIILIIAPIAFKAEVPFNLGVYFTGLFLMLGASLSVGTLLGLLVKSISKLTMVSQLVFLPSVMLSGIMFPEELLPKALQYAGIIFPAKWGYRLMCQTKLEFSNIFPLIIMIILPLLFSGLKLYTIKSE